MTIHPWPGFPPDPRCRHSGRSPAISPAREVKAEQDGVWIDQASSEGTCRAHQMKTCVRYTSLQVRSKINPKINVSRIKPQESHQQDRHINQYPRSTDEGTPPKQCSHCGSRKHDDLGCWRCLTCDKCGKRGHPSDRSRFVCRACGEIHEAEQCPMEAFYNLIRRWSHQAWGDATRIGREDVKLECSLGWNPVRVGRSSFCIYAYVEKQSEVTVNKAIDNKYDLQKEPAVAVASRHQSDEYSSLKVKMILDIAQRESRGYWNGAEVSILDTAYARKVGFYVDNNQTLQCEGVAKSPYMAEGRTRLKITLAGSLVHFFDAWVGPPTGGQDLMLGIDFMVPAGIRPDLVDGSICLPDEARIQLAGRRPLYGDNVEHIIAGSHCEICVRKSKEVKLRMRSSDHQKLWVAREVVGYQPTLKALIGLATCDHKLVLERDTKIAMWLTGDRVPRLSGYDSVGSRRDAEWSDGTNQGLDQQGVAEMKNPEGLGDGSRTRKHAPTNDLRPIVDRPDVRKQITTNDSEPFNLRNGAVDLGDEEVCIKEGGGLYAEAVERYLALKSRYHRESQD
ncbi:unnamed protein product [Phytophthora fragariaefolia]|uniref:Unnamed protein product n=1 Tax=Phytophthora fragariaefolia TaxID=1490495 RepID=A0A9W6Y8E3_9STRA|nr:unnamed protein product [Phytophthora fragariaefolia]